MKFRLILVLIVVIINIVSSRRRSKSKSPIQIIQVDKTALCFTVCAQDPNRPRECVYASDKVDDKSDDKPIKCKCTLESADGLETKRIWEPKHKYERLDKGKSCKRYE